MAGDDFDVEIDINGEPLDVATPTREVLEEKAIETQNQWIENLERGVGATGEHRGGYVNTGEAANDVTVEWLDDFTIIVGGDVVQLAVAEYGRVPTPGRPPPFDAIADWAREKQLEPGEGETFEDMVDAIRWAIADRGLEGFAPAQGAANKVGPTVQPALEQRIEQELEERNADR